MNVSMRKVWTQEEFFAWAPAQTERYEFDGFAPELMTGGTINHSLITLNIHAALRARLRGGPCRAIGPNAGVATVGSAVRYPDMLVTCTAFAGGALIAPEPIVIFEVVGGNSSRRDRIVKAREYRAVTSILKYVLVDSTTMGVTILSRTDGTLAWSSRTVTEHDILELPEIDAEIPVTEIYEGIDFTTT